ncbi:GNAT family N-acetyltransferase [Baaleninema simplex]|uniref:GNAT family N-acetyltransferase n=1 Tax=Baaleninema simplex TaxID=2862350 RepID=UPI00034B083D
MRTYRDFLIRDWTPGDRDLASRVIATVLAEYGLPWEPDDTDRDSIEVERFYQNTGGAFWVVERHGEIVGTAGFYPISRGDRAVELRKMYLHPSARGVGLGKFLLKAIETDIANWGFKQIWIETASVLAEAVRLYEKFGYQPATEVETPRCDRAYVKTLTNAVSSEV